MNTLLLTCLGFTTISFIQFSLFGTALPIIVLDLGIGYDLVGILMALWTLISVVAALIFAKYLDSINIFWLAILELAILSISSLLTAFSYDLAMLNLARILLSFSMPFIWPICAKIVSMYVTSRRYGYSTAIYNIGSVIGLALTYIIIALVDNNWRTSMIISGVIGLTYIPIMFSMWRFITKGMKTYVILKDENSYRFNNLFELNKNFTLLGILLFFAFFFALYTWGFIVNWLSTFLIYELKFNYSYVALYMILIAIVASFLEITAGKYSDSIGGLEGKIRILYIGLIPSAILLLLSTMLSDTLARMISITFSIAIYRIATPSFWSIVNEVIPVKYMGEFSAIYTLAGPLAGITSSILNGYIVALTNSIKYGVVLASTSAFISTMIYTVARRFYMNMVINYKPKSEILP
jgi:ACS family D-galactonate transporter-like MFS transporter